MKPRWHSWIFVTLCLFFYDNIESTLYCPEFYEYTDSNLLIPVLYIDLKTYTYVFHLVIFIYIYLYKFDLSKCHKKIIDIIFFSLEKILLEKWMSRYFIKFVRQLEKDSNDSLKNSRHGPSMNFWFIKYTTYWNLILFLWFKLHKF